MQITMDCLGHGIRGIDTRRKVINNNILYRSNYDRYIADESGFACGVWRETFVFFSIRFLWFSRAAPRVLMTTGFGHELGMLGREGCRRE
jgi:hypothetical protein